MVNFPKFQIFKGTDNLFYFRLSAINGEILIWSEGYTTKHSAIAGVISTKRNATPDQFEKKTAQDKQFYFILKAANGETLARSETYWSEKSVDNGISGVIDIAVEAPIEDLTINAVRYVNPKFQIYKGKDLQHYFRLNARNGENILASEGYASKQGAKNGIASVRAHAITTKNFDIKQAANGLYYFNLLATNGEIIGTSETFVSSVSLDNSIQSVIALSKEAPIEDLTLSPLVEYTLEKEDEDAALSVVEGESPVKNPKFQVFEGQDGQFYFRLKAQNGEIILASEGYVSKQGAEHGIDSVKEHAKHENLYEKRTSSDNRHYFVLRADNDIMIGQVIGVSEMYSSEEARNAGILSVMKTAPSAAFEDTTHGALVYPNPKFEIFRGEDDEFYFRLNAINGEIILASEGYTSRSAAKNGIVSVKKNAVAKRFEKLLADNGEYYFNLKARNGQVIGTSETYETEEGRDAGIESVIAVAEAAPVEDQTLIEKAVA